MILYNIMKRSEAIKIYLSTFSLAERQIQRLIKFNTKLSNRENADNMGEHYDVVRHFQKRYRLKHRIVPTRSK